MIKVHFFQSMNLWGASFLDNIGQLGDAQFAETKELACYNLGVEMGRNPQNFARPISEYFESESAE